jgi:hypothetical protein
MFYFDYSLSISFSCLISIGYITNWLAGGSFGEPFAALLSTANINCGGGLTSALKEF